MLGVAGACRSEEALDIQFAVAAGHSDKPWLAVAVQATYSWAAASADGVACPGDFVVVGDVEALIHPETPRDFGHRHHFHCFQPVQAR